MQTETVWLVMSSHGGPLKAYSTEDKARTAAHRTNDCYIMPLVVDGSTWVVRDQLAKKDLAVYSDRQDAEFYLARIRVVERPAQHSS